MGQSSQRIELQIGEWKGNEYFEVIHFYYDFVLGSDFLDNINTLWFLLPIVYVFWILDSNNALCR